MLRLIHHALMRLLLLLLVPILFSACEKPAADTGAPLRIGMSMNYPPFEMRDESGKPAGVSVDLGEALAARLGRPAVFENMPFDGLMPALKTGRIDIVISSMTATDERRQSIEFSEPYLRIGLAMLAGAKTDIQSAADLRKPGRIIAVIKATTGHLWAGETLQSAELLVLSDGTTAALEVAQGKADAFIYDQLAILRHHTAHPETTRAVLAPIRTEGWAIGLRKGDDTLRTQVNAFLAAYRESGGFEQLTQKWLAPQKARFDQLGVPFVF